MTVFSYLDIHSHRRSTLENTVTVGNLSLEDLLLARTPFEYNCGGIHPWWMEEQAPEEIRKLKGQLEHLLKSGLLWGVGETGLDRTLPELLDQQKELFLYHLELSEHYRLPLIIHNVRSGSDFLETLKARRPSSPWLFHDFRGNEQLMQEILRLHPVSYFSFGISLDNSPQVRELLPKVPLSQLFLETDEQRHLDIHDIYLRASQQLGLDLEFLKSQLWLNFNKITPQRH